MEHVSAVAGAAVVTATGGRHAAGMYRIFWSLTWNGALANTNGESYVSIQVGPGGGITFAVLMDCYNTQALPINQHGVFEVNLPDDWFLFVSSDATGVGNKIRIDCCVQPL